VTILAPEPATTASDGGDDLSHAACPCFPDVALCGVDVSGWEWAEDGQQPENPCVVCVDLDEQPCPRCGQ
jgi:hypothetical protein